MALKQCKECKKEISTTAKKCPQCGKVQKNWFMRHKILTFFGVIIFIGMVGSMSNTEEVEKENKIEAVANKEAKQEPKKEETKEAKKVKTNKIGNGKYLVGKDIQSGLYKATVTDTFMKMGYIERASDINMGFENIIANIVLTGNGYVEILKTDVAVKLQGVELEPIKIEELAKNIKKEASDGIYLVNYDLAPGTYKVEVTDKMSEMGYVQRSKSVAMGFDDIIANEIIQGSSYVKIEKGDFAVRLQGVKITLQE